MARVEFVKINDSSYLMIYIDCDLRGKDIQLFARKNCNLALTEKGYVLSSYYRYGTCQIDSHPNYPIVEGALQAIKNYILGK